MAEKLCPAAAEVMKERFGHDNLIALATVEDGKPFVRAVNSLYIDGSFYVITHALSGKIRHIEKEPATAICGDWFTGQGIGRNLGHVSGHPDLMEKLRSAFADWYRNGHVNENDPNTVILQIELTDGVLFDHGTRYDIDFTA